MDASITRSHIGWPGCGEARTFQYNSVFTYAELNSASTDGVYIVPPPQRQNVFYQFQGAHVFMKYSGGAFGGNATLTVYSGTPSSHAKAVSTTLAAASFMDATADVHATLKAISTDVVLTGHAFGSTYTYGLVLVPSAQPTIASSTSSVYVSTFYRVLTTPANIF